MTFSRIVMSSNVAGTWKVRPIPRRACASAVSRVTSVPSKTMRPLVGARSPAMQLKKVDLPAPLGPIRPTISPASTESDASASATKPPNAFETSCVSSSMHHPRGKPSPELQQTAGLEAREDHDDAAVEDEGEPAAAAAEPGIGGALQGNENDRADQRAVERAGAAERGDDDHLNRDEDTEPALGIHEAHLEGIE